MRRRWPKIGLTVFLAVGVAFGLLLGGAWTWAGTEGSLATVLSWAQRWSAGASAQVGTVQVQGAQGSLRHGGRVAELRWQRDGLTVQAQGLEWTLGDEVWWGWWKGRGLQIPAVSVASVQVQDQRAPTPTQPLQELSLPLALGLNFAVGEFTLSGPARLSLSDIEGHYAYGQGAPAGATPQAWPALPSSTPSAQGHRLWLKRLRLAQGEYSLSAQLGGLAPMPVVVRVQALVDAAVAGAQPPVQMQVQGQIQGTLSGAGAVLQVDAQAHAVGASPSAKPLLSARAEILPWAKQPVRSADVQAQALNVAAFWPSAPATALSGHVQVKPEGEAWLADLDVRNARVAPADQGGLPLHALSLQLSQRGETWTVKHLKASVGTGQVQGQGEVRVRHEPQGLVWDEAQAQLAIQGVQVQQLWSSLGAAAVNGQVQVKQLPQAAGAGGVVVEADVQALVPAQAQLDAAKPRLRLQAQWQARDPTWQRGVLTLREARLNAAQSEWDVQGQWDSERQDFDGHWVARMPGAQLQGQGVLAATRGQGDAQIAWSDAEHWWAWLRGLQRLPVLGPLVREALASQSQLTVSGQAQAQLKWAGGWASWLGPRGPSRPARAPVQPVPSLQAELTVPQLKLQTQADASPLTWKDTRLQVAGPMNALRLQTQAQLAVAAGVLRLNSQGELRSASSPLVEGDASLTQLSVQWQDRGDAAKAASWALSSAQDLHVQWAQVQSAWRVDAGSGRLLLREGGASRSAATTPIVLAWQRLRWQDQTLDTQGQLQGLTWAWLQRLAARGQAPGAESALAGSGLDGDLVLGGAWRARLPLERLGASELDVVLQREQGDLRWRNPGVRNSAPLVAGIREARLALTVQGGQAQAQLRWDTQAMGQAKADARVPLSTSAGAALADGLPPSTPLQGRAELHLPELGVWSRFSPPGWRVRGRLDGEFSLAGSLAQPDWRGQVSADDVALQSVVDGIAFTQGQLRATLSGERIDVQRLSLQGQGGKEAGGQLEATGHAQWSVLPGSAQRQPQVHLQAKAEHLRLSTRVDRRMAVSGQLSADLQGELLTVRGQLRADAAQIILPDELAPSLGDDVVVRGTRALEADSGGRRVKPDVDIQFDFGPQFVVRGQGIDTRLAGQVRVRATPDLPSPRALGEVRTVAGTYRAYGQIMNIETGILRFTGPLDDPSLDILALRKLPSDAEQRVGVRVTGSAQTPVAALYAEPDLPNVDKLAWLVLGRPASAAGAQAFVLQQAAQQLLARSGQTSDKSLAQTFQLDALGLIDHVDGNDPEATQTALVLGKRLSDKLYLSYEQTLNGTMSTVSMLYNLSRRFTLRARAGTENAIDLIFTLQYQ